LIVHDAALRSALLQESSIRETLDLACRAQIALVGIGGLEPGETSMLRSGYVTQEEIERIKREGAVGEICGRYVDIRGRICRGLLDDRIMGIDLETLRAKERVIAVVVGDARAQAVLGALRGHYVHTLVTDERCAARVLEMHRPSISQ